MKRNITPKFKDAFIIAFKNGEKMNVNEAIKEFKRIDNIKGIIEMTKEVKIGLIGIAALAMLIFGINY